MQHKSKILKLAFITMTVILLLSLSSIPVAALSPDPEPAYSFITRASGGLAEASDEQAHSGMYSAKLATVDTDDGGYVRFEFTPYTFKLDDLTTLSYWEYISARDNPWLDVFVDIWLDFDGDGDADSDDYPGYMQAEPYYTTGPTPFSSTDTWTPVNAMNLKWSTFVGPDYPYEAPTIYDFQANTYGPSSPHNTVMNDWTGGVDFGDLYILRIDVRVGYGGPWTNFTGYADDIQINDYLEGFEPPTKADILIGSGVPGKGLENAPGLQKQFNPNSNGGKKE